MESIEKYQKLNYRIKRCPSLVDQVPDPDKGTISQMTHHFDLTRHHRLAMKYWKDYVNRDKYIMQIRNIIDIKHDSLEMIQGELPYELIQKTRLDWSKL